MTTTVYAENVLLSMCGHRAKLESGVPSSPVGPDAPYPGFFGQQKQPYCRSIGLPFQV
ncbi:hypothetical protein AB7211_14285 [Providencia rettgeri]